MTAISQPHSGTVQQALLSETAGQAGHVLVIEPDAGRRQQVAQGLAALGYCPHAFAAVEDVRWSVCREWAFVLTGAELDADELQKLDERLKTAAEERPPVRSLRSVYTEQDARPTDQAIVGAAAAEAVTSGQPWSEEFRIRILRWVADEGPAVLRPVPDPAAPFGHAYPRLEHRFKLSSGDAVRVLEDLADFGVLARTLANRVHLCPQCRRWTINFRETCPSCSSLEIDIEGMIHHFACAYVGLDSEYHQGTGLRCPKCGKVLRHIGLDYERPRQTYVCRDCEQVVEDPVVTAQCLDCRWEGTGGEVYPWPVYEYQLTARGHEAIERGELRGLKLREMIRTSRYALASREFFELEVERESYRLGRYRRPMSILVCRFMAAGSPYPLFRECDQQLLQDLAARMVATMRSLDVTALVDATAVAILLPETLESGVAGAIGRLTEQLGGLEMNTANGSAVKFDWKHRSWQELAGDSDEPLLWFQEQLPLPREEA